MIGFERWAEVKGLYRHGWSIRKMAEELGMDRKTVRKVLSQERPEPYKRTVRKPSILAPFMGLLVRRAPEVDYCAQRLFLELKELGYGGSYNQVKRAVRPLREERRWLEEAIRHRRTLRDPAGAAGSSGLDQRLGLDRR